MYGSLCAAEAVKSLQTPVDMGLRTVAGGGGGNCNNEKSQSIHPKLPQTESWGQTSCGRELSQDYRTDWQDFGRDQDTSLTNHKEGKGEKTNVNKDHHHRYFPDEIIGLPPSPTDDDWQHETIVKVFTNEKIRNVEITNDLQYSPQIGNLKKIIYYLCE